MSRLLRVVVLAGVFAIMSVPSGVQAESQAGGLPVVSDRVKVLEGITVNLQTAVTGLQTTVTTLRTNVTTLQTQVTTLQSSNTDLQAALDAEIAARKAADTALQDALDAEVFGRKLANVGINTSLAALKSAVDALESKADNGGKAFETAVESTFLPNGDLTTVAVLDGVPAGRYFVMAKAFVENIDHDAGWTCYLLRNDENFPNTLDISGAHTNSSFPEDHSHVTLAALATLPAAGKFRVQCFSIEPSSDVRWVKIIAVAVQ